MSAPTSHSVVLPRELVARCLVWFQLLADCGMQAVYEESGERTPNAVAMDELAVAFSKALEQSNGPEGDGWNAGIEAAAKLVDEKHDPCEPWLTGDEVRALKRPEAGAERGQTLQEMADFRQNALDAARYRWLNRQDNYIQHIEKLDRTRYYRLKCGEALDLWIDERIKEESNATSDGGKNG